ncbi:hypothetical protein [Pontibacter cellulosilyticus]|uniref:HEAT repeat domain-containing protein n=1 Tax=Pontibacter cellulosilyticus TaxID=1720253 RepID=A0A923SJF6_9BACT|nr:hypothetical protein [Pontibacter cellulosilyticus]MBC5992681.1 hypothetical protein [Pontibacter cellulosilyticus]
MKKAFSILFAATVACTAAKAVSLPTISYNDAVNFSSAIQDTTKSKKSKNHVEISSNNGESKGNFIYINNGTHEEIKYNGTITLTNDNRDVKSISPDGYLRYEKKENGVARKLEIESDKSGNLTRKYYEAGKQVAYEPAGKQWLQLVMPEIIIKTGIGLEAILEEAYKKNSAKGVLAEADRTTSDSNRSKIIRYLLAQPNLPANDVKLALEYAGKNTNSDYELGKLLRQIPSSYLAKDDIATAYLQAAQKISSDYEMRKALSHILTVGELSNSSTGMAIKALSSISSDYEKSKVIQQLAEQKSFLADNYKATFAVINSISSDYEKAKSISSILSKQKLSEAQYQSLFPVVTSISSDYEKSKVLRNMAARIPSNATALHEDYRKAAKTISSEYEYKKAMEALN